MSFQKSPGSEWHANSLYFHMDTKSSTLLSTVRDLSVVREQQNEVMSKINQRLSEHQ